MGRAKRHAHKYHRVNTAFGKVWACALPDCTHYMPNHMEQLLPGKNSMCWTCDGMFILNPLNMKDDKPICEDCRAQESMNLTELEKRFIDSGSIS